MSSYISVELSSSPGFCLLNLSAATRNTGRSWLRLAQVRVSVSLGHTGVRLLAPIASLSEMTFNATELV
jgi:hypothetical protein